MQSPKRSLHKPPPTSLSSSKPSSPQALMSSIRVKCMCPTLRSLSGMCEYKAKCDDCSQCSVHCLCSRTDVAIAKARESRARIASLTVEQRLAESLQVRADELRRASTIVEHVRRTVGSGRPAGESQKVQERQVSCMERYREVRREVVKHSQDA